MTYLSLRLSPRAGPSFTFVISNVFGIWIPAHNKYVIGICQINEYGRFSKMDKS